MKGAVTVAVAFILVVILCLVQQEKISQNRIINEQQTTNIDSNKDVVTKLENRILQLEKHLVPDPSQCITKDEFKKYDKHIQNAIAEMLSVINEELRILEEVDYDLEQWNKDLEQRVTKLEKVHNIKPPPVESCCGREIERPVQWVYRGNRVDEVPMPLEMQFKEMWNTNENETK